MGLIITSNNADFSASYSDFLWPVLSETTSLHGLFVPRLNFAGSSRNRATSERVGSAGQIGAPTYGTESADVDVSNSILFNVAPSGLSHTIMCTVEMRTGGALEDGIVGAKGQDPVTQGMARLTLYNRRVTGQANSYASSSTYPASGGTTLSPYIDLGAPYDGSLQVFFFVLEAGVSAKLYHPESGATNTVSATGREFGFSSPYGFRTIPSGTAGHTVGAFAYWSRALDSTEVATTYAEISAFYERVGISL